MRQVYGKGAQTVPWDYKGSITIDAGVESGKWKVESGKWKVESGKWKWKLTIEGGDTRGLN
jgi:hypothetical protein